MKNRDSLFAVFFLTITAMTGSGCRQDQNKTKSDHGYEQKVRQQSQNFFETFAARSDWDTFCSFYREDMKFKDIVLQIDLDSLWKFKRFYKWDEERDRFKKLTPEQEHMALESLVVQGNTAVGRGHLNPFYYDGTRIDTDWGMEFTIWLYFDTDLKIIEQHDWFEYDPYTLETVIKRCREHGFEAIPDWLDLSREE